jgi:hypothetical protein
MMIFEHEIPNGSKLYFGKSAKMKREIEFNASQKLEQLGFEEIVTPLFSYHQHDSFENMDTLIRLNDNHNHTVTLRADSTPDVLRIATKRLGRSVELKKWFYIQPTVTFPTTEQYQVGGEILHGDFKKALSVTLELLSLMSLEPLLQISNMRIPQILNEKYGISIEVLKNMNVETLLSDKNEWIKNLVTMNSVSDLDNLDIYPQDIRGELQNLKDESSKIKYKNIIISPLYYSKMRYYESLTFKMFSGNSLLAMGGSYKIDNENASGFAIYTDECITMKMNQGIK